MSYPFNFKRLQTGFSLIEVMVGLVIGLIATLVVMQTFSTFEGKKRTTTGTSDAQTNGNIALFNLQREIQFAGYGFPLTDGILNPRDPLNRPTANPPAPSATPPKNNHSALRCDNAGAAPTIDHDKNGGTPDVSLVPVQIIDGGAGASDTLVVNYGVSDFGGLPTVVDSVTGNSIGVSNVIGCRNDDVVLVVKNTQGNAANLVNNCMATIVTSPNNLLELPGQQNMTVDSTAAGAVNIAAGDHLTCLGALNNIRFDVDVANRQLRRNGQPLIADVVSLQAQYGISNNPRNGQISFWVDATGVWANPGITSNVCNAGVANRNCIKAVRVGVIAINPKRETAVVSSACSSTSTPNPTGVCAWAGTAAAPAPMVAFASADWARYRYRSFDIAVPLRNMLYANQLSYAGNAF